jgi:hypothetical protein
MSRGPGKWQRLILDRLALNPHFWLRELLPRHTTKSQMNVIYRAAQRLCRQGRVDLRAYPFAAGLDHQGKVLVTRPGWRTSHPLDQRPRTQPLED